ncbi:MAG: hypothetical protein KAS32_10820 [Candidatus Peribacteraceae bacterium]|nr:hypothetical protein [Candidatus Peribacteraceae bacterium]
MTRDGRYTPFSVIDIATETNLSAVTPIVLTGSVLSFLPTASVDWNSQNITNIASGNISISGQVIKSGANANQLYLAADGKVGIGKSPFVELDVNGRIIGITSGASNAVVGSASTGNGIHGISDFGYGVYGISSNSNAGYFAGTLVATGATTINSTLHLSSGSITDDNGTIDCSDDHITTTGNITCTDLTTNGSVLHTLGATDGFNLDGTSNSYDVTGAALVQRNDLTDTLAGTILSSTTLARNYVFTAINNSSFQGTTAINYGYSGILCNGSYGGDFEINSQAPKDTEGSGVFGAADFLLTTESTSEFKVDSSGTTMELVLRGAKFEARNQAAINEADGIIVADIIGGDFRSSANSITSITGTPVLNFIAGDFISAPPSSFSGLGAPVLSSIGGRFSAENADTNKGILILGIDDVKTLNIGLDIGSVSGATNNYAIRTSSGIVQLGDDLTVNGVSKLGDGGTTNYTQFSATGYQTMHGSAKVKLTTSFTFQHTIITAHGKPTQVSRGVFNGFSLPVYNNDNEELFTCECAVPEWDGVTDPVVHLGGWLDTANNAKKFNLQVSVETADFDNNEVLPITTNDYTIETTTGNWSQYTGFKAQVTLDASVIGLTVGKPLAIRVRRIAASADEIAGEVVIEGAIVEITADKIGGTI